MSDSLRRAAVVLGLALIPLVPLRAADCDAVPTGNGAVFFHPDGTSAGHWDLMRLLYLGPDGSSNWDRMPRMAAYRGHLTDGLTSTSNAGATIHATGTRTWSGAFGRDRDGNKVRNAEGGDLTIMEQAVACGLGTALIQSGTLTEPGTAAFVADVANRYADAESIAQQVVESGVDFLLGAGEQWLLPKGELGRFGEGARTDGKNLIERAEALGYAVVYTRAELRALDSDVDKVLGVFGLEDTYFDMPEEEQREQGLPNFLESAPTIGEMTAFVLERLAGHDRGFLAVIEEEASDNMCNRQNASGCLEAMKRADDAIGVMLEFIDDHPRTFMVTASDSNAGGPQLNEVDDAEAPVPATEAGSGALLDGRDGTETMPFLSAPDREGRRFPFSVAWAVGDDTGSSVIARAAGHQAARRMPGHTVENTEIYNMLRDTLFQAATVESGQPE